ncbi:unnamed protein product [Eruca vesicaria subsp. sativa]|uniref:EF-hand domain-containing protein n=1 Tax=Eruca vesicaria subsp. sativa TaxID=29727 RepID=A0ABC8JWA9_ERUVS|nr:unnamed protein product [Eruca vesicaria subsp. sativa]
MEAADIDKSGTIDYGEFIAATIHLNKLEREEHLLSAFSYFAVTSQSTSYSKRVLNRG